MKSKTMIFVFSLFLLGVFCNIVSASHDTTAYLFYGEGCPHCAEESMFLDSLLEKYQSVEIVKLEIYYDSDNYDLFNQFCDSYGCSEPYGVPTIFVGDNHLVGYRSDSITGAQIESVISYCVENGCVDPMEFMESPSTTTTTSYSYDIPIIGEVNLSDASLPVITVVLGLMDGFNPCAMFILCFLLVFLIGTKSRKKIFIVGGVFLFISGLVYFLFITAWFNFFMIFSYVPILKVIVGVLVIVAGLLNVKDYFFFQKGFSLTLPKSWKPKVMDKMKKIASLPSLPAMIVGVVTVAFVVNIVELMCTIGFPMIYTQILTAYNLSQTTYYLYILAYCLLYMVDDFILFSVAVGTLSCMEMTQKRVRIMKLVSGILMILLAVWFMLS